MISKENYEKFLGLSVDNSQLEGGEETFTFTLEAIARIVDVAYNEGRINELTVEDNYAEDVDKINRMAVYQKQVDSALNEEFEFSEDHI